YAVQVGLAITVEGADLPGAEVRRAGAGERRGCVQVEGGVVGGPAERVDLDSAGGAAGLDAEDVRLRRVVVRPDLPGGKVGGAVHGVQGTRGVDDEGAVVGPAAEHVDLHPAGTGIA